MLISNETESYLKLKERTSIMKNQRIDIEKDKLVEDGKMMEIDEMILQRRK